MTWLTGWNYRKAITVSNAGSVLTDYQVLITIDTAGLIPTKMRSDCGDIRFTSSDGSNLNYWIQSDCNTTSTKIWVKIPLISNGPNAIYMYYGNPGLTSTSNGINTFVLFDDFSSGSIAGWTQKSGTAAVISTGWSSTGTDIYSVFVSGAINSDTGLTKTLSVTNVKAIIDAKMLPTQSGITSVEFLPSGGTIISSPGTILNKESLPITTVPPFSLGFIHSTGSFQANDGGVYVDRIRVRKYTSPEPTTCIGGEEVPTVSWLPGWNRRKLMTITGSTSGIQTDYQMKLTVHKAIGTDTTTDIYLGTNVKDDFSDLRFTSNDGSTLLNYWIESYTSGSVATVWIKIPLVPIGPCTATIYIYYNNPSAASSSNGTNTFLVYDDFNDLTNWVAQTSGWSVANGILTAADTGSWIILRYKNALPINTNYTVYIKFLLKTDTVGGQNDTRLFFLTNGQNPLVPTTSYANSYYDRGLGDYNKLYWEYGVGGATISPFTNNVWYVGKITVNAVANIIELLTTAGTSLGSYTETNTSKNGYNIGFGEIYGPYDVDWIRVHKYALPEPTFSATGTEEILATPAHITATTMTITPSTTPCISGSCTVTVDVIWTNTGGTSGSFIPSIKIDTVPIVVSPPLTLVTIGPSLTASQQFVISGLTTGTHTICPDPN